jgi:hypothetical protein
MRKIKSYVQREEHMKGATSEWNEQVACYRKSPMNEQNLFPVNARTMSRQLLKKQDTTYIFHTKFTRNLEIKSMLIQIKRKRKPSNDENG